MEEYLPPCKLTIMVFLHLKIYFTWRIHTSVYFNFSLKNINLCVSFGVFSTWKCYLLEEYTPLYECFSIFFCWRIPFCELTTMVFPSLEYAFFLKNKHLCISCIKWCFLHLKKNPKNIHLCTSWQKWYFLHLKMPSTWRIYT